MATKELTRADFKDVESIIPTPEEAEVWYWTIYYSVNSSDIADASAIEQWDMTYKRYLEARFSGMLKRELSYDDAWNFAHIGYGTPMWKEYGETEEEATELLYDNLLGGGAVKAFMVTREVKLRTTFCKEYLAPLMLLGMRGGILVHTWWRAVCYGFSVKPYTYAHEGDEKPQINAFPYRSIEEMTEEDRRAFLWTVEDVYYFNISWCSLRQLRHMDSPSKMPVEELQQQLDMFQPYPEEGYPEEKLAELHSLDGIKLTVEDIHSIWIYEMERFFSAAIHALDKALYYAMKFKATEYLDYIHSLDAVKDYKYHTDGVEGYDYDEIMKEGYIWD